MPSKKRKYLRLALPKYLEAAPGFRSTRAELQKLFDFNGEVWKDFPLATIADMARMEPRASDVNLTDTILPKDRPS
jgi:hypothetical protein